MNFKDLLIEKFEKGVKVGRDYYEVFKNPTLGEIESALKNDLSAARVGLNPKTKAVYVWDANVLHGTMKKHIPYEWGFIFYKDRPSYLEVSKGMGGESTLIKNKNLQSKWIAIFKKYFPKLKVIA